MWYKNYNWKINPFIVKFSKDLVGLEKEKQSLMDYIHSGDFSIITAPPGLGKTSLLQWVKKNLGLKYKVQYLNMESVNECDAFKKNIKSSLFRKKVLLLDEAQLCNEEHLREIKSLWDNDKIMSVVLAQTTSNLGDYSESIKNRIGKRLIKLKPLDLDNIKKLIELRTENKHPFNDEMIDIIAKDAKHNPRKVLENCELVCIELNGYRVDPESVKKVLTYKKMDDMSDLISLELPELPDNLMPINDDKIKGFSPMQKRIIRILLEGNRSTKQMAHILNTSSGSVGKQLSNLIEAGAVKVANHRRPKVYTLKEDFKADLY